MGQQVTLTNLLSKKPFPPIFSPEDSALFLWVRVTGTGFSFREKGEGEFQLYFRDSESLIDNGVLEKSIGMWITDGHPEDGEGKGEPVTIDNAPEYTVGTLLHIEYVSESREFWGVAKIFDSCLIQKLKQTRFSTSPLYFTKNRKEILDVKVEVDFTFNSLAIVPLGHWDVTGVPNGIYYGEVAGSSDVKVYEPAEIFSEIVMPNENETKGSAGEENKTEPQSKPTVGAGVESEVKKTESNPAAVVPTTQNMGEQVNPIPANMGVSFSPEQLVAIMKMMQTAQGMQMPAANPVAAPAAPAAAVVNHPPATVSVGGGLAPAPATDSYNPVKGSDPVSGAGAAGNNNAIKSDAMEEMESDKMEMLADSARKAEKVLLAKGAITKPISSHGVSNKEYLKKFLSHFSEKIEEKIGKKGLSALHPDLVLSNAEMFADSYKPSKAESLAVSETTILNSDGTSKYHINGHIDRTRKAIASLMKEGFVIETNLKA